MQLSPHFSLAEFCRSDAAARHGIDNDLPAELLAEARRTAQMLEAIRAELMCALRITSGYRCQALNALLGSKATSDHTKAMAADFEPEVGTVARAAQFLARHVDRLGIGQLILEYPDRDGWVHVSSRRPVDPINRVLTITRAGTQPGIVL